MKSHWIAHKGKRILYCDYRGYALSDFDELKAELEAVEDLLSREPDGSVLGLSDIRGSVASGEVVDLFKKSATRTGRCIRKQAVVGVMGLNKVLFQAVVRVSGQNAKPLDDVEQAKDWLVEDSG
jgi:hypothetical protein